MLRGMGTLHCSALHCKKSKLPPNKWLNLAQVLNISPHFALGQTSFQTTSFSIFKTHDHIQRLCSDRSFFFLFLQRADQTTICPVHGTQLTGSLHVHLSYHPTKSQVYNLSLPLTSFWNDNNGNAERLTRTASQKQNVSRLFVCEGTRQGCGKRVLLIPSSVCGLFWEQQRALPRIPTSLQGSTTYVSCISAVQLPASARLLSSEQRLERGLRYVA